MFHIRLQRKLFITYYLDSDDICDRKKGPNKIKGEITSEHGPIAKLGKLHLK